MGRLKMKLDQITFKAIHWEQIPPIKHLGEHGYALWRTQQFNNVRVRIVQYSAGYLADLWCLKGHLIFCLEGEVHTELEDSATFTLTSGMSYQVTHHAEAHRSSTLTGAKLFIVD